MKARFNYALALNEAHEFLGNLLNAQGQIDRAIAHYREAIRIQPDFDRANLDLGLALASSGNPTAALPYLRKAAQSRDTETHEAAQRALEKLTSRPTP